MKGKSVIFIFFSKKDLALHKTQIRIYGLLKIFNESPHRCRVCITKCHDFMFFCHYKNRKPCYIDGK